MRIVPPSAGMPVVTSTRSRISSPANPDALQPRDRGCEVEACGNQRLGGRVGGWDVLLHPGAEVVDDRPNRLLRFHLCREGREGEVPEKTRQKAVPDRTSQAHGPDGAGRRHLIHTSTRPRPGEEPTRPVGRASGSFRRPSADRSPSESAPRGTPPPGSVPCRRAVPHPPRTPSSSRALAPLRETGRRAGRRGPKRRRAGPRRSRRRTMASDGPAVPVSDRGVSAGAVPDHPAPAGWRTTASGPCAQKLGHPRIEPRGRHLQDA